MRVLLDTHTLLWAARQNDELSKRVRLILKDRSNSAYVSAVSAWEIATKVRVGKMVDDGLLLADFVRTVTGAGYTLLSVHAAHGLMAGSFPHPHKDPFDRMLAAQALVEELVLLSKDANLDDFGVQRIW